MSRRRPKAELQFGSDSFLDVVANIVGILIILIVIAGLRVSHTPAVHSLPALEPAESPSIPLPMVAATTISPPVDAEPTQTRPTQIVFPEEPIEIPPLPELVPPGELVDLSQQLESAIAATSMEEEEIAEKLKKWHLRQAELLERQKAMQGALALSAEELEKNQQQAAKVEADLDLARETLRRLTKQLEELQAKPTMVQTLQHKITPVSRVVNGKEKHYRLQGNRIAEVPVDELVNRLKEQIERRKDWLVKTRQHQGQIGPLRGFTMSYLVRVDTLSGLDELRAGHGGYRISLEGWEIRPELDMRGETATVALRKGSNFYQSILGASPDTTLTFWVYPDSFAIYRKLQKFTHDHGFSVAGRPLPDGIHISGSPNGSKSASQ
ncbi:hypothetical protein [Schlesneria sp. DSM 10557]|uniref:hypothetical protein n=1 Tax=Schlesneria sp. DSM 10557 TaxID=3044399 RepID=UPI00359F356E